MNWRHIAITGLVAGMVAVTGCSTNLPETNQGNRNGQRVADAVNRREDTYRTTGHRLGHTENYNYNRGTTNRVTRGIRRMADNVMYPTRNTTRSTNNNCYDTCNGTNTHRNITRSTNTNPLNIGRPQGRIGNAFRYGHNRGYVYGLHNTANYNTTDYEMEDYGYDTGITTSEQALVNNRTTRSMTPVAVPNNNNATRVTTPARSTTKRIDTKRKATPAKTTETSNTNRTNSTNNTNTVSQPERKIIHHTPMVAPVTPNRAITNRTVANRTTTNNATTNRVQNHNNRTRKAVPNATTSRNEQSVTRGIARNNRYGMSYNTNQTVDRNQKNNYMDRNTTSVGMANTIDQTVPVMSNNDNVVTNDNMAFFRKKTEEPTNPTTPQPMMPPPTQPTTSYNDNYYNSYDDSYDDGYDDSYNDYDNSDNENNAPGQVTPNTPLPTRSVAQRAMK